MIDFTSARYLGLDQSSACGTWSQLSTGVPAALFDPPGARAVANQLARLQGCQRGTLGTSTLHLFWDLFGQLSSTPLRIRSLLSPVEPMGNFGFESDRSVTRQNVAIYVDEHAYPIARWGVERAASYGTHVGYFKHHSAEALKHKVEQDIHARRPIIVTDGLCPSCGCVAPLNDYLEIVQQHDGLLIIDDTQAFGVLGKLSPSAKGERSTPYGRGGGGSLPYRAIQSPRIIGVNSLAKAWGVPVAVLSGSDRVVRDFEFRSQTRVHCSPPSAAVIQGAKHALRVNRVRGDQLRQILSERVVYLHSQLSQVGLRSNGEFFPVQTLRLPKWIDPWHLYRGIRRHGLRTILQKSCRFGRPQITLILTTKHSFDEIDWAIDILAYGIQQQRAARRYGPEEKNDEYTLSRGPGCQSRYTAQSWM